MSWYRTGTVSVTNGSKTVTGVGTLWTSAVNAGDAFALVDANLNPTGAWYEVESVTDNTTLVLKQSYAGTTGSNLTAHNGGYSGTTPTQTGTWKNVSGAPVGNDIRIGFFVRTA